MRHSRTKNSILTGTSLAITATSATLSKASAETIVFSADALESLNGFNGFNASPNATTLDFRNLSPEMTVGKPFEPVLDISGFENARNIILPWFAAKLNIRLPESFFKPNGHYYSTLKFITGNTAITSQGDQTLDIQKLLDHDGKVNLDVSELNIKELIAGRAAVNIKTKSNVQNLTLPDTLEYLDTNFAAGESTPAKSVKLLPRIGEFNKDYYGIPDAVTAFSPEKLDLSEYDIDGKNVNTSAIKTLKNLIIRPGDCIGQLTITGENPVTFNSGCVQSVLISSDTPDPNVLNSISTQVQQVLPADKDAHAALFAGETNIDFSKVNLGNLDSTVTRLKYILDTTLPLNTITSLKIDATVLSALMTKLGVNSLTGFTALERLDIVNEMGTYQTSTLTKAQLPPGITDYYSKDFVIKRGALTDNLTIDARFDVAELDLSELDLNGYSLTIDPSFNASKVTKLCVTSSVTTSPAASSLMQPGTDKTFAICDNAIGVLNTNNLPNVGTLDLREASGITNFTTALNVDGGHTFLSKLYLPDNFDMSTITALSGVDDGEVTTYFSGNYVGNITVNSGYSNGRLDFSNITGSALLNVPAGIRCMTLSNGISGMNVGGAATANEFDLSGLSYLRTLNNLPLTATLFSLNNNLASSPLYLDIRANTVLETMRLNSSRISTLYLPISAALTDGGSNAHLNLSGVKDLSNMIGLNELLNQGVAVPVENSNITTVTFPLAPAANLTVDLTDTREGVTFANMNLVPHIALDATYIDVGDNMWPTVPDKTSANDWNRFLNYIIAPTSRGGLESPELFDLTGQILNTQTQVDALVSALNGLTLTQKGAIQTIMIRLDSGASPLDFSSVDFAPLVKAIIDKTNTTTSVVTTPGSWTNVVEYQNLSNVSKSNTASWSQYLAKRFASLAEKGGNSTSLDLSSMTLSAAEWTALMGALDAYPTPTDIQTIRINLTPGAGYAAAPAFTTTALSALTELVIDITGVTNAGTQVGVTGLPAPAVGKVVEQRVTTTADVDHTSAASWQGYFEYLLSNISGTSYTLDLTHTDLRITSTAELAALNTGLAALSDANKLKVQDIKLKLANGDLSTDFNVTADLTGFTNLATFTVDSTGTLNGSNQSLVTFALTNPPAYVTAHVSDLSTVDTNEIQSWEYYLAYRLATPGLGITNLDISTVSLAQQADLTAFLTAVHNQSAPNKASVQEIKLKINTNYSNATIDLGAEWAAQKHLALRTDLLKLRLTAMVQIQQRPSL